MDGDLAWTNTILSDATYTKNMNTDHDTYLHKSDSKVNANLSLPPLHWNKTLSYVTVEDYLLGNWTVE